MNLVRVRQTVRGERMLAIPKELAKEIRTEYMNVEIENGRLTYTPVVISETEEADINDNS